jgi:raffinose/stachyose/melibiose transport system substrate-binding protein
MASRWGRLIACGAMLSAVLSACGGGSSPASSATNAPNVDLSMVFNNSSTVQMNSVIKDFQTQYPNITIHAQYVDGASIFQTLLPSIQAGNAPDLFQTQPGSPASPDTLGAAGKLLDLTSESWTKSLNPTVKPFLSSGSKVYGLPVLVGPHGVAYNKDLFTKLGLTIPTTFSQLLAMCPTITAAGKIPMANAFAGTLVTGIVMGQMLEAEFVYNKQPKFDAMRKAGQVMFVTSPEWRNLFNAVVSLKGAGCFGKTPQGITLTDSFNQFAKGDAVMSILAWAQMGQALQINSSLPYAFFNLPAAQASDTSASAAVSVVLAVSAKTAHPAEAKKFIDFLASPTGAADYVGTGGGGLTESDIATAKVPAFASAMQPSIKAGKLIVSLHAYPNPTFQIGPSGVAGSITGLITGQATVDSALKSLDYLWDHPSATTSQ